MSNPQEYLQKYQYNQPARIPQLVAINCIFNEYDVEFCRVSEYLSRNGMKKEMEIPIAQSTTHSLKKKTVETVINSIPL